MFREKNPGISYGFRITQKKIHLIEEAQKNKSGWTITKVYERYQSHQPQYKERHKNKSSTEHEETPDTVNKMMKPTPSSTERPYRKSILRNSSNKKKLERSTFHRDIFSQSQNLKVANRKSSTDELRVDNIQNEASKQEQRMLKKMNRSHVKTSKRKLASDSSKKTNNIISGTGTKYILNVNLI